MPTYALVICGLLALGAITWGLMRLYRPSAHDPLLGAYEPRGLMRVPGPPSTTPYTTDTYDLTRAIAMGDAHMPYAPHAPSSQRSVAEALEVYECHELERRLASPPPNIALAATMQARNLGAILKALRG